jgi:hypothetical protein
MSTSSQMVEASKQFNKHVVALIESHSLALSMTDEKQRVAALNYLNAKLSKMLNPST